MEGRKIVRKLALLICLQKTPVNNPVLPTSLLLCPSQGKIHVVWCCWPPNKRKFKLQTHPINSTFLHTSHITLDSRECMFKILKAVGIPISKCIGGILPFVLAASQCNLLLLGNGFDTSGSYLFLQVHDMLCLGRNGKKNSVPCHKNARNLGLTSNP